MVLVDEKQGFSRRFKEAMRKIRVDADSPTQVAREFNLRYHGDPVTAQAIRKWLAGKGLPSQGKVRGLALGGKGSGPGLVAGSHASMAQVRRGRAQGRAGRGGGEAGPCDLCGGSR